MVNPYKNDSGVSLAMAVYLATDEYDFTPVDNTISTTGLLRPLKQLLLTMRIPPSTESVEVISMVASRIGTSIHSGIEKAWLTNYKGAMASLGYSQKIIDKIRINPDPSEVSDAIIPVYMEQRTEKQINGYTISGKFDFVAEGILTDFKSTKVFSYLSGSNKEKYQLQGSIYRWLNQEIITKDHMTIQYIFTDYSSMQKMANPDYPASPVLEQKIPLLSIKETENFITDKLSKIVHFMSKPEEDMPACTAEELWQTKPTWKYYKDPTKTTRSTKNFDDSYAANQRLAEDKHVGMVIEVKGEVKACKYCSAFSLCKQKDEYLLNGSLK